MAKLRYVFDAVASIRRALAGRVPLIGFSGSPWTLACYMVEGAGSDDYRLVKTMLYARPDLMHRILAINADAVARLPERADRRRRAGGDGLRQLGRRARRRRLPGASAWPTRERVLRQLKREPTAGACRRSSSPRAAGRGSRQIARARRRRRRRRLDGRPRRGARAASATGVALQGNLDPGGAVRRRRTRSAREVGSVLASFGPAQRDGGRNGHVFNLGHGISQHTPPEQRGGARRRGARALAALPRARRAVTEVTIGRVRDVSR